MREVIGPRRGRRLPAALALLLAAASARADEVEYSVYRVADDRDTRVVTSSFSLAKTLVRRTMLLLDVELDQTAIAPLDGVTGASRPARQAAREFRKSRGQIIAGVEQALGAGTRATASYYFSQEVDYRSHSAVGGLTQELFQGNLTLDLRGRYTLDSVGEITASNDLVNRGKETHQASLTATQLLSPTTFVRLGADGMRDQGFLSNPYRKVARPASGGGTEAVPESHPQERWRQAAWGELSRYLEGMAGSLVLEYRYYWDDWGVEGHTGGLTLNKYVTPDVTLSPEYRYHHQKGADFQEQPGLGGHFTLDWKLMPQDAHTFGLEGTWYLRSLARKRPGLDFLAGMSVAAHYFHYFNDTPLDRYTANVWQGRVRFAY